MPIAAFEDLARLCNICLDTGWMPTPWCQATQVLLPTRTMSVSMIEERFLLRSFGLLLSSAQCGDLWEALSFLGSPRGTGFQHECRLRTTEH